MCPIKNVPMDLRVESLRQKAAKLNMAPMIPILNLQCLIDFKILQEYKWLSIVPVDWVIACMVPLCKGKGDMYECSHFRGICLLSVVEY